MPPPTLRRVVLDGNIFSNLNRGNKPVANALMAMRAAGTEIFISEHAYQEHVANPAMRRLPKSAELIMTAFDIKRTGPADPAIATQMTAANKQGKVSVLSDLDLRVAIDARTKNAEVFSVDGGFANNAPAVQKHLGVTVAPESALPAANGQQDYRVARQILNLPPVEIDFSGNVKAAPPPAPPAAPAPAPAAPAAGEGEASATPVVGKAPTPPVKVKGAARMVAWGHGVLRGATSFGIAALGAYFQMKVLNYALRLQLESIRDKQVPDALAGKKAEISNLQYRGYRAFANILVEVKVHSYVSRLANALPAPWLLASLVGVTIDHEEKNGTTETQPVESHYKGTFVEMVHTQHIAFSYEVAVVPPEMLALLEGFRAQYNALGLKLAATPTSSLIRNMRKAIERAVIRIFGQEAFEQAGFYVY